MKLPHTSNTTTIPLPVTFGFSSYQQQKLPLSVSFYVNKYEVTHLQHLFPDRKTTRLVSQVSLPLLSRRNWFSHWMTKLVCPFRIQFMIIIPPCSSKALHFGFSDQRTTWRNPSLLSHNSQQKMLCHPPPQTTSVFRCREKGHKEKGNIMTRNVTLATQWPRVCHSRFDSSKIFVQCSIEGFCCWIYENVCPRFCRQTPRFPSLLKGERQIVFKRFAGTHWRETRITVDWGWDPRIGFLAMKSWARHLCD